MRRVATWTALAAVSIAGAAWTLAPDLLGREQSAAFPAPAKVSESAELPSTLRETGLYAEWETKTVDPRNRPFSPQYPLWTDGATKRRWIFLPPRTAIDASRPDAWQFPVGTRLWKEFSFGRRAETRFMELTSSGWRYATYVWNEDESEATLAPRQGAASVAIADDLRHAIPSESDCRVCHGNGPTPVLGFAALQLSSDRDPNAIHAEDPPPDSIDLQTLVTEGLIEGWSASWDPPAIEASTATERSALGYLHGNCGSCHRPGSPIASNGLILAHSVDPTAEVEPARETTLNRPSHFKPAGSRAYLRVAPGDPAGSVLLSRVQSRDALTQMPPFGTQIVDEEAVALLTRWILQLSPIDPVKGRTPRGRRT